MSARRHVALGGCGEAGSQHAPADARELAQEALLQAYRCLAAFNGASRFSTWLAGIALNLARNHLKRAAPCGLVEYGEETLSALAAERDKDDPERRFRNKAALAMLARAIDALPPDMRERVVLIALEGHSYEEAATLLGLALGTVKSRTSRARQKLREDLALQGFFD